MDDRSKDVERLGGYYIRVKLGEVHRAATATRVWKIGLRRYLVCCRTLQIRCSDEAERSDRLMPRLVLKAKFGVASYTRNRLDSATLIFTCWPGNIATTYCADIGCTLIS